MHHPHAPPQPNLLARVQISSTSSSSSSDDDPFSLPAHYLSSSLTNSLTPSRSPSICRHTCSLLSSPLTPSLPIPSLSSSSLNSSQSLSLLPSPLSLTPSQATEFVHHSINLLSHPPLPPSPILYSTLQTLRTLFSRHIFSHPSPLSTLLLPPLQSLLTNPPYPLPPQPLSHLSLLLSSLFDHHPLHPPLPNSHPTTVSLVSLLDVHLHLYPSTLSSLLLSLSSLLLHGAPIRLALSQTRGLHWITACARQWHCTSAVFRPALHCLERAILQSPMNREVLLSTGFMHDAIHALNRFTDDWNIHYRTMKLLNLLLTHDSTWTHFAVQAGWVDNTLHILDSYPTKMAIAWTGARALNVASRSDEGRNRMLTGDGVTKLERVLKEVKKRGRHEDKMMVKTVVAALGGLRGLMDGKGWEKVLKVDVVVGQMEWAVDVMGRREMVAEEVARGCWQVANQVKRKTWTRNRTMERVIILAKRILMEWCGNMVVAECVMGMWMDGCEEGGVGVKALKRWGGGGDELSRLCKEVVERLPCEEKVVEMAVKLTRAIR